MKTIILLLAFITFSCAAVHAQQPDPKTKGSDSTGNQFMRGSKVIPFSQMDQRKIYHWSDGERATPTGRQAKDRSAKFAIVYGDSAVVVKPTSGQQK